MRDFKRLEMWGQAHTLTLDVYKATRGFPTDERYGLRSQLRRASSSIPTNIAEGAGRGTRGELQRFLGIAFGSASELSYLLLLSRDLRLVSYSTYCDLTEQCTSIMKMIRAYRKKLGASS
jgi:four helix bundle protein